MKKVVKFGGSSLADAHQFVKVGDIIRSELSRRYVIPSAPGKRFPEDTKVTDMLYHCYAVAEAGEEDFRPYLAAIKERYDEIIKGLQMAFSLDEEFRIIEQKFEEKAGADYAASRGEYLNGRILASYIGYDFIDPAEVIIFKEDGTYDEEITESRLKKRLSASEHAVIPGFYGAYEDGRIHTFSRGGSDITGSIVASACNADLYENWTDVSGVMVTDPRIVKNPEIIDVVTYAELRELSYMGASVLHEDAVFPVRKAGIPINIRNTNAPADSGTMIVANTSVKPRFGITGIAGHKGFISINIEKDMMNSEVGFGRRVLQAIEEAGVSFEHMPSGIDTMSVYVNQHGFEEHEQQILSKIRRWCDPDLIELETDLALIAVVGRGMKKSYGTAARVFAALAHAGINVRMIDQGSSEKNIIIGVENKDFELATQSIYDVFVNVEL
ncbi:MAG: aspartate kinase [Lachnospiraceae bacterium]|nr:aspartate kinase [Lachnospiraceae bacterium]